MALVAGFVLAQVAAVTPTPQADLEACLAQCADCHPAESAAYAGTAMARALGGLRPGELSDLAPVEDARSGFTYAFEGERVVETRALPSGAPWRDAAGVAFAIGAGTVDRAYAVRRGGRLWLAPLELLTKDGERRAALAPAHVIRPGTRFDQPVTTECLACHTDHLPPRDWPLNREPEGFAVRGISCAACHADLPGHVAARSAELEGGRGPPDPLQAERAWSRTLDMERCAACHLQGDARIELVPGRVGPPPPGTPLLASRAVFVEREPREEIGFVSHVERLVLSRCYLDSIARADGGLRCESCHDPHRALSEPDERARVRAACLACHADRDAAPGEAARCTLERAARPPQRECVDCHMRRTGVFDVAEVEIHDHWIRRRTPEPSRAGPLRFPASPTGDWRLFAWPGEAAPDAGDPGPWTLALAHGGHLERAREQAARGTGQRAALLPMLHHVRGSLFERAGELAAARAAYQRALELDPTLAEATINLAPLLARMGSPDAGLALLDDLLALHPLADTAYRNRAVIHAALDDEPSFRADLEAAQRLRPDAELARALARHAERRRDEEAVRRWTAEAHRLDPR
jgi:predicted CXXCH cytochrome family protein